MAEFCYQCTEEVLGLPGDKNDFAGMGDVAKHEQGLHCNVLCEGCGGIQVDFQGKRVGPHPIKLQKELNGRWKAIKQDNSGFDRLLEEDRTALVVVVEGALREAGLDFKNFDIEVAINEDGKTVEWSYSTKA